MFFFSVCFKSNITAWFMMCHSTRPQQKVALHCSQIVKCTDQDVMGGRTGIALRGDCRPGNFNCKWFSFVWYHYFRSSEEGTWETEKAKMISLIACFQLILNIWKKVKLTQTWFSNIFIWNNSDLGKWERRGSFWRILVFPGFLRA